MRESLLSVSRSVVCWVVTLVFTALISLPLEAEESIEVLKQERLKLHVFMVEQLDRDYSEGIASLSQSIKAQRRLVRLKRELKVDYQDDVAFYSKLLEIEEAHYRLQKRSYQAGGTDVNPGGLQRIALRVLKYKQRILESKAANK